MKKRNIAAALGMILALTILLVHNALAARFPDELMTIDWLNNTTVKNTVITPHEYLGTVKIGNLWFGDELYDGKFSVFAVEDSVNVLIVESYTSDRKMEFYSCYDIGCTVRLGYYDSQTGQQVDNGRVNLLIMSGGDYISAKKDEPIEYWFRTDSEGWQPLALHAPVYEAADGGECGDYLGWMSYSAIVLTKSQVLEFKNTGKLAPMLSSTGEDLSSYVDLTELKALLSGAEITGQVPPAQQMPEIVKTYPTQSKVFFNGKETELEAYLINGNNYFKLRDLAMILSGTEKQFEVKYNSSTAEITLTSGKKYTPTGVELVMGDGNLKTALYNKNINISKDGEPVKITAYLINNNNFVKLRDVMRLFDVGVTYDEETRNIGINTNTGYTE